ncbi:MAG: hypothetical protein JWP08_3664 [Bryobacterales bacterium]|nr:hypothetical protein [Bryobacterales bacterium]
MFLRPTISFHNFSWICCGCENLPDQCVWLQCNRSYPLLQLLGGLPRNPAGAVATAIDPDNKR